MIGFWNQGCGNAQFHSGVSPLLADGATVPAAGAARPRKGAPKVVHKTAFQLFEEQIHDHTFHGRWEAALDLYEQSKTDVQLLGSLPPLHPECPPSVLLKSVEHFNESLSLKCYSHLLKCCVKLGRLEQGWKIFTTARDSETVQLDVEFYHLMMDLFFYWELDKNVIMLYEDLSFQKPHPIKKMIPPEGHTLQKAFLATCGWKPLVDYLEVVANRVDALFPLKPEDPDRLERIQKFPMGKFLVRRHIQPAAGRKPAGGAAGGAKSPAAKKK